MSAGPGGLGARSIVVGQVPETGLILLPHFLEYRPELRAQSRAQLERLNRYVDVIAFAEAKPFDLVLGNRHNETVPGATDALHTESGAHDALPFLISVIFGIPMMGCADIVSH